MPTVIFSPVWWAWLFYHLPSCLHDRHRLHQLFGIQLALPGAGTGLPSEKTYKVTGGEFDFTLLGGENNQFQLLLKQDDQSLSVHPLPLNNKAHPGRP